MDTGWEDRASSWLEWARRPNFDQYWAYRDVFFDQLVPAPGAATLDLGCGEGRVTRDLVSRGHSVTAIDASPTLVSAAAALDPASTYQVAVAEQLPFDDASFDVVVAYNVLMDVSDMPAVVFEAGRVLAPGGRMAICVTHPVSDVGSFTGLSADSDFVIQGSYRGAHPFHPVAERDGITMDFGGGLSFDLEGYSRAFERAGLLIERLREPGPSPAVTISTPGVERFERIPNFLMLRLVKADSPASR